jgi:quercetin dioxygenase-like cupin family protein
MFKKSCDQYKVPKGWGYEVWIKNFDKYCGKLLYIEKDKKTSWHYHILKEETLYLQSGQLLVSYGTSDDFNYKTLVLLTPGDSFHIVPGLRHQLHAKETCELFEFSTEHFDTDSIRVIKGD